MWCWLHQTDTVFFGFQQVHHDPDLFHAGGFIATADEIVQPFSLPRSQYRRLRDRAPSPPASDDDVEMVPDSEGVMDEELSPASGRDSTRVIEGGMGYENEGDEVRSGPETPDEPMKTMAELAAEHAERQHRLGLGSTRTKSSGRGVGPSRSRRNAAIDGGEGEPRVDEDEDLSEPSLSDYLSGSPAPSKKDKATSSMRPSRTNPQSSSKRINKPRKKRARSPDVDEGSDMEHDRSFTPKSTAAGARLKRKTTTAKPTPRASRTVSGSNATSIAVPASDRVLRSRKGKV